MVVACRIQDRALLLRLERPATCAGECDNPYLPAGTLAWSYLVNPTHGNYVSCNECRYDDQLKCVAP